MPTQPSVASRYETYIGNRQVGRSATSQGAVALLKSGLPVFIAVALLAGIAAIMLRAWPQYDQPLWVAIPVQLAGLPAVLAGAALWLQQRGNYIGPSLMILGFSWYLGNLQAFDVEFLFVAGFTLYHLNVVIFTHLALVVPHGRLDAAARVLVVTLYLTVPGMQLARYFEVRHLITRDTFGDVTDYYSQWARAATVIGVPLALASVTLVIRNYRRSNAIQRKCFEVFWWTAAAVGSAATIALVTEAIPSDVPQQVVLVVYALAICAAPIGLIFGMLLISGLSREALDRIADYSGALERSVAAALGDPTLRLFVWSEKGWQDESGHLLRRPASERTARTIIFLHDNPYAMLVHDRIFAFQRMLLIAIAALTLTALERRRLEQRMLFASIEGQDAERNRLRADLHDDAQGPLIGLIGRLDRISSRLPVECAPQRQELDEIIVAARSLRDRLAEIVDNLYPKGLQPAGLADAVATRVHALGLNATIDIPYRRWRPEVAVAAYFIISEALTNVAKHARANHTKVTVQEGTQSLLVEVQDDGVGGAQLGTGIGMRTMRARAAALGGSFEILSQERVGTKLCAVLPLTMPSGATRP